MATTRKFLGQIPFERMRGAGGRFASGGAGFAWEGLEVLANNINNHGNTLNNTRKKTMDKLAKDIQAYMQEHAPWRDRTGDARRGLKAIVEHDDNNATSTVWAGHSVDYGVLLETRDSGALAIVGPTLTIFAPQVMGRLMGGSILSMDIGEE
jgi:hypothetical protein